MKVNKKIVKEIKSWIFSIIGAFFIAALINSRVLAKVQVQQGSMENTLFPNQQLVVDKLSYNFIEPKRGDIIIFQENGEKETVIQDILKTADSIITIFNNKYSIEKSSMLVKRIIGTAGDEVDIKDGYVYINGEKLEEPYVKGETFPRELQFPIKVGENKLFVLGDNRTVSKDSRTFGLIDLKQVEGKVVYRVYPFNKIGRIK